MQINPQQRHELEKYKKKYLEEAACLLLREKDTKGAEEAIRKVELSEKILVRNSTHSRKIYVSIAFAFLCLTLVSFIWLWPLPNPRIHLDLDVETAILNLAKDLHWEIEQGLKVNTIAIDGQFETEAPGLGLTGIRQRLQATGKAVTLRWLEVSAGARLEVERGDGYIDLYIHDGNLRCQFELQDAEIHLALKGRHESHVISRPVPEALIVRTPDKAGPRVRLRLKTDKDWRIDGLYANGIAFEREWQQGTGNFVSTILGGTIELPEINRKEVLLKNDWLRLSKVSSTRLYLFFDATDANRFNLLFQGRARTLSAGPENFEQNLAPSLLTYLYHQKQLTFFWSAIVFVYGLLWSLFQIVKSG